MIVVIAKVDYSILSQCAFLRADGVAVVERLSFGRMVTSCESRGGSLRGPMPLSMEWCSLGMVWLLDRLEVNQVIALFVIAHVCEADLSALSDHSWFPFD